MVKKTKKIGKVKKKAVESKKGKKAKKKISKKKKVSKKKTCKKRKKRKKREKLSIDQIYPILNKVQLDRQPQIFAVELIEAAFIENTIKDLNLPYVKTEMKTQVVFAVKPGKEDLFDIEDNFLDIEYLEDEIPDIDQIFP